MKPRFDVRTNGRQAALALAFCLALNVGAYAGLVRPRLHEADRLERESEPRLKQVKAREAEVAAKEHFVRSVDTAAKDLTSLRQEVLSTKRQRMIDVQLELADLARQFSINLESVRYENQVLEEEGLERFAMTVPLKGGYASLRKFLQAVEASQEFLVIEEVALEGEAGEQALELNITLATYFDAPELRRKPVRRRAAAEDEEGA
jgi:Tfp pilus assembly protein PilO